MKLIAQTLGSFMLAAFSASALDQAFVSQMVDSAKNIERDAAMVSSALKAKKPDQAHVKLKIDEMSGDLTKLQELVNQFESANPQLSGRDLADWKMIKEKVRLLEIFHAEKRKLAGEDISKHRTLIRAHAEGVAKRAQMLQQSALQLQRAPVS